MGGFSFKSYQPTNAEMTPFEALQLAREIAAKRWERGDEDYEVLGILQKYEVEQVSEEAVTREEAEMLVNRMLGTPAPGERAVVLKLNEIPIYADHYSQVVGAIPVADKPNCPVVGWLLFGHGNE